MPNSKELEIERQALLLDMAGKINFIYEILSQASIGTVQEEKKSERKTRKKTKKDE